MRITSCLMLLSSAEAIGITERELEVAFSNFGTSREEMHCNFLKDFNLAELIRASSF